MPRGPLAVRSRLGHHPTRPQQLRTSERLDRTQEVGGSSPPSSISRTRAVEPNTAPRAGRGLATEGPGVKQESSISPDARRAVAMIRPQGKELDAPARERRDVHPPTGGPA